MFAHRTATGLTIALLALPATATAQTSSDGGGDPLPQAATPSATTSRSFMSPDAADAARAGEIATAMEHYRRSQPAPVAAQPAPEPDDSPAWPEIAFAGVVVLVTAGGIAHVRMRRTRRVTA